MRLKGICAAAVAALALSGVMASGAAAEVRGPAVIEPSPQEWAEHPGMDHAVVCDSRAPLFQEAFETGRDWTNADQEQIIAEGYCFSVWNPSVASGEPQAGAMARKARHTKTAKASRRHRHARAHR